MPGEIVELLRDCPAVMIPSGEPVILEKGSEIDIRQELGGSYTVIVNGSMMAKIQGKNADAIGKEPTGLEIETGGAADPNAEVDESLLWRQMKTCYDPEIPVNIVDLGLIYDCHVDRKETGGGSIQVKMTLTAPGCGMGDSIAADVEEKLKAVPGVQDVNVELVWNPPWNQSMMTEAAKLQLGLM